MVDISRRVHAALTVRATLSLADECAVIFGPSGAGKSSLLRMIAGLARPDSGSIRLGGETLFDQSKGREVPLRKRRIGVIFQDDLLFPHLDVAANVAFGLREWSRAEASSRVDEIAELCGIGRLLSRRPETLSGGERQRVGLARALAPRPRLLLCDEPVSALDLDARDLLIERIRSVRQAERIPMLYVTHSPAEAVALGTRLLLLRDGQIIADGPPLDVLAGSDAADASGSSPLAGVRNVFPSVVVDRGATARETAVALEGGPVLIVPSAGRPAGTRLVLSIRADDILLARGPVAGLSARNLIAGKVGRVISHGDEAEVIVHAGESRWIVSVVAPAVGALELSTGTDVQMIVKARSIRVLGDAEGA